MSCPLISIVLCTYNGAPFLEAQLQSLVAQTYPNLEVIVSDDASTDATTNILELYKKHPHFRIFYQKETLGPVKNFEFATRQAMGDYIAFCDQDDIWLHEKVDQLYAAIGADWLVYCDSTLVDEKGRSLHKNLSQLRKMYSGRCARGFVFSNVVWGHNILISRQLVPYMLPIPPGIPHDIWIAVKAATLKGIKYVDQSLTLYRQHSGSVTKTIAGEVQRRTDAKRYYDFEEKLYWMGLLRDLAPAGEKPFYIQLYQRYAGKASGRFQWKLFAFLLRYRSELYRFSQKKLTSQLVEMFKQARGVKK